MNKKILVTGSGGLIGRETSEFFLSMGYTVIGIDNNMRKYFFGEDGSVQNNINHLFSFNDYIHYDIDIRNFNDLEDKIFKKYSSEIDCIIHCAAQPSHDWAVNEPFVDYNVNLTSTLNLLELTRKYCKDSVFIFMSTNKVYGDNCNYIKLKELDTRYEIDDENYVNGFSETFSIDRTKHSLFGCSKVGADIYTQEYGKYFGIKTTVFRGGCLTGSKHSGAELHGFLNYLVKCNLENRQYNLFGYKGKQVRDNIHSSDLVKAFYSVYRSPRISEVYNIGGGIYSNCSILEAINIIENITGNKMNVNYVNKNREGDHIWWISDITKFKTHYPEWNLTYDIESIISEIINNIKL